MKKKKIKKSKVYLIISSIFSICLFLSLPILFNNSIIANASQVGNDDTIEDNIIYYKDICNLNIVINNDCESDLSFINGISTPTLLENDLGTSFNDVDKRFHFSIKNDLGFSTSYSYNAISINSYYEYFPSRYNFSLGGLMGGLGLNLNVVNLDFLKLRFLVNDFVADNYILNNINLSLNNGTSQFMSISGYYEYYYYYYDLNYNLYQEYVFNDFDDVSIVNFFDTSNFNVNSSYYSYISGFNCVVERISFDTSFGSNLSQYNQLSFNSYVFRSDSDTIPIFISYLDGQINNTKSIYAFDITQWLVSSVGSFMGIELYPGFALIMIISVFISLAVVLAFLRLFAGG